MPCRAEFGDHQIKCLASDAEAKQCAERILHAFGGILPVSEPTKVITLNDLKTVTAKCLRALGRHFGVPSEAVMILWTDPSREDRVYLSFGYDEEVIDALRELKQNGLPVKCYITRRVKYWYLSKKSVTENPEAYRDLFETIGYVYKLAVWFDGNRECLHVLKHTPSRNSFGSRYLLASPVPIDPLELDREIRHLWSRLGFTAENVYILDQDEFGSLKGHNLKKITRPIWLSLPLFLLRTSLRGHQPQLLCYSILENRPVFSFWLHSYESRHVLAGWLETANFLKGSAFYAEKPSAQLFSEGERTLPIDAKCFRAVKRLAECILKESLGEDPPFSVKVVFEGLNFPPIAHFGTVRENNPALGYTLPVKSVFRGFADWYSEDHFIVITDNIGISAKARAIEVEVLRETILHELAHIVVDAQGRTHPVFSHDSHFEATLATLRQGRKASELMSSVVS
ncbi:hypothetical protein [Thermosulfurimonas sp. F29]|uniref:hypothetical protein n=1 Tax=Thermosulfurimonas sp. F29 TaxID=2867247 RepID=UPI001C8395B2|nr:hypothetical protein [Thermosulfurimonas sp. F29]MBX6424121.1 hypothetical protein [Thermosulfurimonas sp. F29]